MPNVVDHDATREELAGATWRVITTKGIDAATTREIAGETRWSKDVLAHYFKNKNEILLSAIRLAAKRAVRRMKKKIEGSSGHEILRNVLCEALPLDRGGIHDRYS